MDIDKEQQKKERIKRYNSTYYQKNREILKQKAADRYRANNEYCKQQQKEYYYKKSKDKKRRRTAEQMKLNINDIYRIRIGDQVFILDELIP